MARSLSKILSGGQTGVDRAALDAALEMNFPCGGWCPAGRRALDGRLDRKYPLRETRSRHYNVRTRLNVRDSDATLILNRGEPEGGTAYTLTVAHAQGKPCLVIDPAGEGALAAIHQWLAQRPVDVLNVAGPREAKQPGIYDQSRQLLRELLHAHLATGAGNDGPVAAGSGA